MAKNNDLNNIFSSYLNNVLLNEAVKPTEEGGQLDPAKAAQKRQELLRQRGQEVKAQAAATQQPATQQPAVAAPTTEQPAAPAPQETDDESGYEEVETTTQTIPNATQTQPLVTSDDGQSYTLDQIKQMINNVKTQTVATPDQDDQEPDDKSGWEEVGQPEREDITSKAKKTKTVAERKNISKFLRCLSEKNYSLANKYLNKIIETKVKRKVNGEIK